jgi:hypothetical protein
MKLKALTLPAPQVKRRPLAASGDKTSHGTGTLTYRHAFDASEFFNHVNEGSASVR